MKRGLIAASIGSVSLGALAITAAVVEKPVHQTTSRQPLSTEASGYPAPPLDWENGTRIQAIRQAGLHRDRSQLASLPAALQERRHPDYSPTALHALARLGATEALPAIDSLRQQKPGWGGDFATVARARLLAEADSREAPDTTTQAAIKMNRYYQELHLSPSALTAAVVRYQPEEPKASDSYIPPTLEVYAMRELADIVYMGPYSAYHSLPGVTNVDFSKDYPSLLKIQLAPLSQEQRLAWLINDLAHKKILSTNEYYELQLAADGGTAASHLAMAKLREMDNRRDEYAYIGFAALFDVLDAIRDKDQAPIFVHFSHDRDPWVAHFCNNGVPRYQFVRDY